VTDSQQENIQKILKPNCKLCDQTQHSKKKQLKTLTGSFPRQTVSPASQPSDYTVQEAGKAQTDGLHGKKEHWGK
jgi:hypothetical protein